MNNPHREGPETLQQYRREDTQQAIQKLQYCLRWIDTPDLQLPHGLDPQREQQLRGIHAQLHSLMREQYGDIHSVIWCYQQFSSGQFWRCNSCARAADAEQVEEEYRLVRERWPQHPLSQVPCWHCANEQGQANAGMYQLFPEQLQGWSATICRCWEALQPGWSQLVLGLHEDPWEDQDQGEDPDNPSGRLF